MLPRERGGEGGDITRTLRTICVLGLAAVAPLLALPDIAAGAQVCGCKKILNGKIKRLVSPGPPTCSSTYTPICWNEGADVGASAYTIASAPLASATATALDFDTERWDTGDLHSPTTNPSRFTVPLTGRYVVTASSCFDISATGMRHLYIRVNGTGVQGYSEVFGVLGVNPTAGNQTELSTSAVLTLNTNDYVEAIVWQNTGGALNTCGGDLSIQKLN